PPAEEESAGKPAPAEARRQGEAKRQAEAEVKRNKEREAEEAEAGRKDEEAKRQAEAERQVENAAQEARGAAEAAQKAEADRKAIELEVAATSAKEHGGEKTAGERNGAQHETKHADQPDILLPPAPKLGYRDPALDKSAAEGKVRVGSQNRRSRRDLRGSGAAESDMAHELARADRDLDLHVGHMSAPAGLDRVAELTQGGAPRSFAGKGPTGLAAAGISAGAAQEAAAAKLSEENEEKALASKLGQKVQIKTAGEQPTGLQPAGDARGQPGVTEMVKNGPAAAGVAEEGRPSVEEPLRTETESPAQDATEGGRPPAAAGSAGEALSKGQGGPASVAAAAPAEGGNGAPGAAKPAAKSAQETEGSARPVEDEPPKGAAPAGGEDNKPQGADEATFWPQDFVGEAAPRDGESAGLSAPAGESG
ncbi:unnamed protein product, partial [Amoebophrya sp. A25]